MFNIIDCGRDVLKKEAAAIQKLSYTLDSAFIKAVGSIFVCNGKIIVTGMGKSGIIGRKIAATLSSTGTPSIFLHAGDALHGDIGLLTADDIVLAISYSGETSEINDLIPIISALNVPIITITGSPFSTLAKHSKIVLTIDIEDTTWPMGYVPSISTTLTLALGDALAIVLIKKRGFTEKDFVFSHPSGQLNKRLMRSRRIGEAREPKKRLDSVVS